MRKNTKIVIIFVAVSLIIAVDCQGGHKQKKQEMKAKWQKTACEMKLSAAMEQFDSGQYEQAEAVAKECIHPDLNLPDAHLLLGKVGIAKGDFSGAKSSLETYVNLKQSSDEGWFLLALACEHLKDNASALKWYQKALELSPENIDYAIAVGSMYVAQNEFAEAEKFYQQQIAANPANTDLKIAAAQMYLAEGQNDKAVGLYEQAHLLVPENNEMLEALGSCCILAADWQKAGEVHKQLYQRCTDRAARNRYMKIMAYCATNAGDYSLAMKYYSLLTAQDENNASLWISMGQAALGADLTRQALICSRKALALAPDMAEAYLLSGAANYKNGSYSQAVDDFHKAAVDPVCVNFAWLMSARCYEKMGYVAQAKAAYEKASQFSSDSELQQLLIKSSQEN
jgi:tetratricopeptide (TPR) repeat protein